MKLTQRLSATTVTLSPENKSAALRPVHDRPAGEVAADPDQGHAPAEVEVFPFPELEAGVWAHDPFAVIGVDIDGDAAEGAAPLDRGRLEVRVVHRDRA